MPLITIITVVYNAKNTIESTIKSVLQQRKELFEYWIIDGNSKDGSLEIIRKYESQLAGWISEADNGIFDAMNKGIDRANGEWIYFLGADDVLQTNILELLATHLERKYAVVFGDVIFDNGYRMRSYLGNRTLLQNTLHHQSAFYNKSNFSAFLYDNIFKSIADYELNLKIYLNKDQFKYVPLTIAVCGVGGASSNLSTSLKETNSIRTKYVKQSWKKKLFSIILNLYYAQKKIRRFLYNHQV